MSQDFDKCVKQIEDAYFLLEDAEIDLKVQRALATALFIYALQAGPDQKERAFKLAKNTISDEEIAEILEDQEFEEGDYYLLLPLFFALRALETSSSNELIQGINLLIEAANCLNEEKAYELRLTKKNPLKDDELFLKLLKVYLKLSSKLFTDERDDLKPEEVLKITKVLGIANALTHVTTLKHAARIADSIGQDAHVPPEEKADIFIMALKSLLASEEDIKLAIVFTKMREYEFAKEF